MEEFGGKAYRMGKGSKDDTVVALLKDQLDEFKQVLYMLQCTFYAVPGHGAPLYVIPVQAAPVCAVPIHDVHIYTEPH